MVVALVVVVVVVVNVVVVSVVVVDEHVPHMAGHVARAKAFSSASAASQSSGCSSFPVPHTPLSCAP